jgi:hypothetical protein
MTVSTLGRRSTADAILLVAGPQDHLRSPCLQVVKMFMACTATQV